MTTHDEIYRDAASAEQTMNLAAKEVTNYATALRMEFELVKKDGLLTNAHILRIQEVLEQNDTGFRTQAGTKSDYYRLLQAVRDDELTASGILRKRKVGRTNYYINEPLVAILTRV